MVAKLSEELDKLNVEQILRVADIWGLKPKSKEKKSLTNLMNKTAVDEYFLKGVLEKLTPIQVQIYALMVSNRNVMTLGEISRKIKIQAINVEKELSVLKHLLLVVQRKNRERITSNLDKYIPIEEIKKIVHVETNEKGEQFQISTKREIEKFTLQSLAPEFKRKLGSNLNTRTAAARSIKPEVFKKILHSLKAGEQKLLDEAFNNGGIIDIGAARVVMDEQKLSPENTLRLLHNLHVLRDIYYIDERFVRVLVIPLELFEYLKVHPIFPLDSGIKELNEKRLTNELDFVLNMKKLLLFISNKGLTLSQSEKIRQADMKRSEIALIETDIRLFPEKSQVHQIEILLPFLKLFDLVDLRNEDVILKEHYEEFLRSDPLETIKEVIAKAMEAAEKRMVGNEVFLPLDVPFLKQPVLEKCKTVIEEQGEIYLKVMVAEMIRESVVLSPEFRVKDFKTMYLEHRSELVSAIFYMHSFGLLEVDYPKRLIRFSELGKHYFFEKELSEENRPGAVIINPDGSMVAKPESLSLSGLHLLKSFSELKEFDRVYTFQLNKDSLQTGILLGNNVDRYVDFLKLVSKNRIPQNLTYLISEWSEALPIVTIEEGVVLLETSDAKLTQLLVGQIKGKKMIKKELSPTALIIHKNRVQEVMEITEKLEMIVKLIR